MQEDINTGMTTHHTYDRKALFKNFDRLISLAKKVGQRHFDEQTVEQLARQFRGEFEEIIPLLPYVGGKARAFTKLMIQSGQTVAFYRACKGINLETRQIGQLLYEIAETQAESIPRVLKWFVRRTVLGPDGKSLWRKNMEESQSREYPMNWVGEFVEGDGATFEYGLDFVECGFMKLAREMGCEEIAPYVCLADFARMSGFGIGFRRTQTLARGHPRCDFRFGKNYETPKGWPPENLDEVRNSSLDDGGLGV
jgi:hypothetical protein